ncbi:MAG: tetratricopeptide repeat protein [Anaerolineales bacterium]|nr:tetratricopeptide repeat protein [Anaerolineales bacterium]
MNCTKCGSANPEEAKFCLNCGAPFITSPLPTCKTCGTELPDDAIYCYSCGTRVSDEAGIAQEAHLRALRQATPSGLRDKIQRARRELDGARKPVTILFADIVGSTAIAEKLDPEDWRDIVAGAHQLVGEAIYRYEGTIAQLLGDGVLAFFGAPITHEDDPVRAVLAAIDIQEAINKYDEEVLNLIDNFQMRVGINTGLVVIGDIGTDMHVEYLAFGDSVNLAARLESAAEPGTILVSEGTHKLIAPVFRTKSLGSIEVKGKAEPIPSYQILEARAKPGKMRGLPGLASPLIGRASEFHTLLVAMDRLNSGDGGIISITGEAGIGKSRLVAEARAACDVGDFHWVEGRCLSYGGTIPYHFWLSVLNGLLEVHSEDDGTVILDKLENWLIALCPDRLNHAYPFLGHLMSLPLDEKTVARVRSLEGEDLKTATFHAIEMVIECLATTCPLVLICEDLHWSDPTSIELLERILGLTPIRSLLVLCISRPEPDHISWRLKSVASERYGDRHTEISLNPLSEGESESLVKNLVPLKDIHDSLAQTIMDHAEGNPFYLEEILRSLIDSGSIFRDKESGIWQTAQVPTEISIPDTLNGVLLARIDQLDESIKRVLQMAAVIGRIFELSLLERIVSIPRDLFTKYLSVLESKEFIRPYADDVVPQYIFHHSLTQDVAYESLLKRQRRFFHGQVGEILEELSLEAREERVELIAHHFLRAQRWEKAWDYHLQAGEKAKARFANQEAIDFLQMTLVISEHLPQLESIDLADVHIMLAEVQNGINRYKEALAELDKATMVISELEPSQSKNLTKARISYGRGRVLRSMGEYEDAIEAIQEGIACVPEENPQEQGALKIAMASALTRQGHLEEAQHWCIEGMKEVEAGNFLPELAHAYHLLGTIRRNLGDTAGSLEYRQKSLKIAKQINSLTMEMEAHNNLAVSYYDLGQLEKAVAHYDMSKELSEQIGNVNTEARANMNLGEVYLIWGEWVKAREAFLHAVELCERTGWPLGQAYAACDMGAVLIKEGLPVEALGYLQQSQRLFAEIGAQGYLPIVHRHQAAAYLNLGELATAEEFASYALELATELSLSQEEGSALRLLGMIYREKNQLDQAEAHIERSVEIFREAGVQYEEARALLELARVWLEAEQVDRIAPVLDDAIDSFRNLGAQADLQQAEDLLTTVS